MCSTMLKVILVLQLLTSFSCCVETLPITSKPIESTAEQMAWQAWLLLPPEQKNLEKSRKVTPKSIFTLPNRSCPPGHQLFQSNCIPIVNIDEKELLTQQLLGFVVEEANANNQKYEYDYDDIGGEIVDFINEQSDKLNGDHSNKDAYQYDQLPSQDEPLKFNIFQQKFPTDYETESMPSDELPNAQLNKSNTTELNVTVAPLEKAVNALTTKDLNTNTTLSNQTSTVDLQMDSSNVSVSFAQNASIIKNSVDIVSPSTEFSLSDIDAIILPAMPTHNSNLESSKHNIHKVSLFKDDSSVQLVTSTLIAERNVDQQKQPDLSQLLKADDLLPLPNIGSRTDNVGTATLRETPASVPTARTRTSSIYIDNDVSTLSTIIMNGDDTTTPLSENIVDDTTGVTTFPNLFDGFYENGEKVAILIRDNEKKGEHPRSVKTKNETSELTEPQEENFTTTNEPDVTTNFQLDDTTVDEVHDAPTIALKELLELAQHPSVQAQENLSIVVKKSKVEPVEIPPIIFNDAETTPSVMTTSTRSAPTSRSTSTSTATSISPTISMLTSAGDVSPSSSPTSSVLVLETSTQSSEVKNDRFGNQQLDISTKVYPNQPDERQRYASTSDEHLVDSKFRNTETATTTAMPPTTTTSITTPTSEIDIKQELRMINELVKGNKKRKEQSKVGIIKPERSSTTESRLTTTTTSTTSGVKNTTDINDFSNNNDKNVESKIKETTLKQQEDESINSTVKTNSTQKLTTETTVAADTTATIWSKIVPLFDFSTISNTPSQSIENMPKEISSLSSSKPVSNDAIHTTNDTDRSNRNSKIFRLNSIRTPSFSESDSNKKYLADKLISSTTTPASRTKTTELTDSSTTTTTTTTTGSTLSDSENDPFWWLPIGWSLDRSSDVVNEQSLLLRLWSAFPESEGTSKLRN